MANIIEYEIVDSDATDGAWTSGEHTVDSTRAVTLAVWGSRLRTLNIVVEISTYNDGSNDIWVPLRSLSIGIIEEFTLDENIKLRVNVTGFTNEAGLAQTLNVTTGGGNT